MYALLESRPQEMNRMFWKRGESSFVLELRSFEAMKRSPARFPVRMELLGRTWFRFEICWCGEIMRL